MGKIVSALSKRHHPLGGGTYKSGTLFVPSRDNKWMKTVGNHSDKEYEWLFGGNYPRIRVPSLKRSLYCWKNFYRLFPFIYEQSKENNTWIWNGFKLKQI